MTGFNADTPVALTTVHRIGAEFEDVGLNEHDSGVTLGNIRCVSSAPQGRDPNLRVLWRSTFDAGAGAVRTCQEDVPARLQREEWLKIWNKRVDNTLALLYTSSRSRGLPHRLTRNLAYLVLGNDKDYTNKSYRSGILSDHPDQKTRKKASRKNPNGRWIARQFTPWVRLPS
ncbi:hypothetical protein BD779DRAFT_1471387 [Infundibulicybe gibba]|nr:hypothetical protein BD779DRAFT_1471387 [Infundibulicybe gibba]